jgi:hypothetical protein
MSDLKSIIIEKPQQEQYQKILEYPKKDKYNLEKIVIIEENNNKNINNNIYLHKKHNK